LHRTGHNRCRPAGRGPPTSTGRPAPTAGRTKNRPGNKPQTRPPTAHIQRGPANRHYPMNTHNSTLYKAAEEQCDLHAERLRWAMENIGALGKLTPAV